MAGRKAIKRKATVSVVTANDEPTASTSSTATTPTLIVENEIKNLKENDNHVSNPKKSRQTVKSSKKSPQTKLSSDEKVEQSPSKLDFRYEKSKNISKMNCVVLSLGQGDTGQLGLGEDVLERSKPALVKNLPEHGIVDICCGGMHSLCIDKLGDVYSFGCNDEGALGRLTSEDEECYTPGKVEKIPSRIVQISAGDSHSAALSDAGQVFYWGTFRDSSGSFGLTERGIEKEPVLLKAFAPPHLQSSSGSDEVTFKQIASGSDHLVLLSTDGRIYTLGCGEQGQLGRIGSRSAVGRSGRLGLSPLHTPMLIHTKNKSVRFSDIWAGSYATFGKVALSGSGRGSTSGPSDVYVCGLNNYHQLGVKMGKYSSSTALYTFTVSKAISQFDVSHISPGQHHALMLSKGGKGKGGGGGGGEVYALGRSDYGRLGLGPKFTSDAEQPTPVSVGDNENSISHVACGSVVSFGVSQNGSAFSWGMGTNGQLGCLSDDSDVWTPTLMKGKQLENRIVLAVSAGGQHTLILACDKNKNSK